MKFFIRIFYTAMAATILLGCDYLSPKKEFILAIPETDQVHLNAATHLAKVLEEENISLKIVYTKDIFEALAMVSSNKADLTMAMNHSIFLIDSIEDHGTKIRTILPFARRFMFVYVPRDSVETSTFTTSTFQNKIIGVDNLKGETRINMQIMLERGNADGYRFTSDPTYDIYHTWGTANPAEQKKFIEHKWKRLGLDESWIKFIDANNPYLHRINIPSIPSLEDEIEIKTLYTESVMLGSRSLGEKAVLQFTQAIYKNKTQLFNLDRMFTSMDDRYDRKEMLFPLHAGAESYLNRDNPNFLERYADALAFLGTILAFLYAGIISIRNQVLKKKKDQVDLYFTEFLLIKENTELNKEEQIKKYDDLFRKVLLKMTEEKLNSSDFNILARLLQTELTLVNMR